MHVCSVLCAVCCAVLKLTPVAAAMAYVYVVYISHTTIVDTVNWGTVREPPRTTHPVHAKGGGG